MQEKSHVVTLCSLWAQLQNPECGEENKEITALWI